MSTTVLVIAGLHALPPLIGAAQSRYAGLFLGTVIGVGSAFILGAGRYTVVDLIGVAIGFFLGWCICKA